MSTDVSAQVTGLSSTAVQTIGLVSISYNCGQDIANLINRLLAGPRTEYQLQFFVVDNASSDDSLEHLNAIESDVVTVIPSDKNVGFGPGCNLAFEQAKHCDKILLLNPDVELFDDSIDQLVQFSDQRPDAKIWGGLTLDEQHQPDGKNAWREPSLAHVAAWAFHLDHLFIKSKGYSLAAHPKTLAQRGDGYLADAVSGCFLLIDNALLQSLGGFDERYFMYSEEIDLCRRAREQGAQPQVCTQAKLIHAGSATVSSLNKLRFLYGSKLKYYAKHWSAPVAMVAKGLTYFGAANRAALHFMMGLFKPASKNQARQWWAVMTEPEIWRSHV